MPSERGEVRVPPQPARPATVVGDNAAHEAGGPVSNGAISPPGEFRDNRNLMDDGPSPDASIIAELLESLRRRGTLGEICQSAATVGADGANRQDLHRYMKIGSEPAHCLPQ